MYTLKINILFASFIFFLNFFLLKQEELYCKEVTKISLQPGTKGVIKEAKSTYNKSLDIFDSYSDMYDLYKNEDIHSECTDFEDKQVIDQDQPEKTNIVINEIIECPKVSDDSCYRYCCDCQRCIFLDDFCQDCENLKNKKTQINDNNQIKKIEPEAHQEAPEAYYQDKNLPQTQRDYEYDSVDGQKFINNNLQDISSLSWESLDSNKNILLSNDLNNPGYREYFSDLGLENYQLWEAKEGDQLRETIEKWGSQVGWKIIWEANCDYKILSTIRIAGTIDSVIAKLIGSYINADNPLRADLYPLQTLIVISNF